MPEWNPFVYGGTPFLAKPGTGVFYPPSWLFLIFDPWRAVTAFVLFHLPIAAAGTLLLAKRLGMNRSAAVLAATAYLGSGYANALDRTAAISISPRRPCSRSRSRLLLDAADRPGIAPDRSGRGRHRRAHRQRRSSKLSFFAVLFSAALAWSSSPDSPQLSPPTILRRALGLGAAIVLGAALGAVQLISRGVSLA